MKKTIAKKSGFTLVELLLVVGIIALGSTVAYIVYEKVRVGNLVVTEGRNLATIVAGAEQLYAGSPTGVNTTNLINSKIVPQGMLGGTHLITNASGGEVNAFSLSPSRYYIRFNDVEEAVCINFLAVVANANRYQYSQVNVAVNMTGGGSTTYAVRSQNTGRIITMAEAVDFCTRGELKPSFHAIIKIGAGIN